MKLSKFLLLRHKALTAFFYLSLYALSLSANAKELQYAGLGVTYDSGIYQGQDGYASPLPMIKLDVDDFFVRDKVIGWTGYRWNNISVSLIASYNDYFLKTDDIGQQSKHVYLGIEDRKRVAEVGFLYTYNSPVGTITWEFYKPLSSSEGGMHNITRLARPSGNPNLISFTPSIYVHYFSSAFNDYYYGISHQENIAGYNALVDAGDTRFVDVDDFETNFRPTFEGANSGQLGIDLLIQKPYGENLVGIAYLGWEEVLGEQQNSSLVEDSARYTFKLGMAYKF